MLSSGSSELSVDSGLAHESPLNTVSMLPAHDRLNKDGELPQDRVFHYKDGELPRDRVLHYKDSDLPQDRVLHYKDGELPQDPLDPDPEQG